MTKVAAVALAFVSGACLVAAVALAARAATSPTDPTRLPIGDGKVTLTGPKRGWVFACQPGNPNAGGAFKDGPWIKGDGSFDLTAKVTVDGSVAWSGARFSARRGTKKVTLSGNGLPVKTTTGTYPIAAADDAFQYDRNPNSIASRSVAVSLPVSPRAAKEPSCLPFGAIGYATNGGRSSTRSTARAATRSPTRCSTPATATRSGPASTTTTSSRRA
jgi:hypothetical protein